MTCIVGFVDKKNRNVIIGADSAGVGGTDIDARKDCKVFKKGEFVIGCTSSFRMIQLLRFSFNPPSVKGKDIYEYMCTDFINAVRQCFKDGGYLQKGTMGDEKGGTFLVGYKNRLFYVGSDFQVGENINGLDSCGCGQNYAKGALLAISKTKINPKEKVKIALTSASTFSTGVCKPFVIIETK